MIEWLKAIEKDNNVEILFACEAGSRAWGLESEHSDYDLRFIYRHKNILSYLSLDPPVEVLNESGPYDLQGWDIKKALTLLRKSNPSLYEWSFSEVIYLDKQFLEKLRAWILDNYCPYSLSMHYMHLCSRNLKEVQSKTVFQQKSQKQLLYAVRSFIIAREIVHRKSVPPLTFIKGISFDFLTNYYHDLVIAKQSSSLISMDEVKEIFSLIEGEKMNLLKNAEDLQKKKNPMNGLNEWLWDLLEVNH